MAGLLDVARLAAGRLQLQLEDVDLAEVAAEAVERLAEEAASAGVAIALRAEERRCGAAGTARGSIRC